jgi:hypothetical protein
MDGRPSRFAVETSLVALVLLAVFLCGYSAVSPTNFGGYDEWWIRALGDRLVLGVPYANRPLNFLWTLPGGLIGRGFTGYYIVHGLYLWLAGVLLYVLLRRLWTGEASFPLLAAAFVVIWAPSDRARLCTVQGTFASGATLSLLLAVVLLVEARWRGSPALLVAAGATAWATIRGYEATLPLLLAAPLFVLCLPAGARGWRPSWWLAWAGPVGLAVAQTLTAAFLSGEARYQMENARLDPHPPAVLSRLAFQYERHLLPLVTSSARELRDGRVGLAAALFLGGAFLVHRLARGKTDVDAGWRRHLVAIAAGLAAAGLGYAPYVLSRIGAATDRTEYVSGPGIATALAAAALLIARPVPARWRWLAAAGLGCWVVAVGTGRTLAMQRYWDGKSAFPQQQATLRELKAIAPDLEPRTLVVLVDRCGHWPAVFTFRHAVEWTYGRRATGFLWRPGFRGQLFYPTAFGAAGVRTVPWESIQRDWDDPATLHGYDEIVAVRRQPPECRVSLEEHWPEELPPLPPGARYAPGERIIGRPGNGRVLP